MFIKMDVEEISFVLRDTQKELHLNYKDLLEKGSGVIVTSKELKSIEENYYQEQAKIKLAAAEHTHSFSDQEMLVFRWAKSEFDKIDPGIRKDISDFQRKLERLDSDLENLHKHHLTVSMELITVEKEIDALTETKSNYFRILKDMETKFKQSKSFFTKFGKKILSSKTENLNEIKKEDLANYQDKLSHIELELNELYEQRKEKNSIYRDSQTRVEELKEKKQGYSEQLCNFISIYMGKH